MQKQYQVCSRCVMDSTDPAIVFNSQGFCNHCTDFIETRSKYSYQGQASDDALNALVQQMKAHGKKKKYDCIVGLSGGIDSCYTAWKAKSLGLRVLCVHLDNGWNTVEANQNIRNIASKLSLDYECEVLHWEEFRQIQLAFLKASIPEADTPTDIAILSVLHKAAAKYGVRYILSGGNFATEGILPKHWHYNAKDLRYFKHICKQFGPVKINTFPTFGFLKESYYKIFKGIKMVYFLNYFAYDKNESKRILEESLDWKNYGGKHLESRYTGFIQTYYLFNKFKIDYRRATLSSEICAGILSRETALEILTESPYSEAQISLDKEYVAKKLEISSAQLEQIICAKPFWYSQYPNSEYQLNLIYSVYRWLFKKEKLASV